ncbi:aminoglycoside adenylyltransferase domain-containing protein [Lentibacillus sediminis]|uniref:aminoglycoside adenylyltransferase domain-containing protein n=1 Tax=Lentibacillus sediminis TaxID=1940529 RepID=UPI00130400EA
MNLCRVLLYLKNGKVASKKEGGEWALDVLSSVYYNWVAYCLKNYVGASNKMPDDTKTAKNFAAYMLQEIRRDLHGQSIYFPSF